MKKNFYNEIMKSACYNNINLNSYDYQKENLYAYMMHQSKNKSFKNMFVWIEHFLNNKQATKKEQNLKNNFIIYSIKINSNENFLTDEEFINIVSNFRVIVLNFCELCQLEVDDLQINILSAESGCFNINFGLVNISGNEFNVAKLEGGSLELTKTIIEALTGNQPEYYNNKTLDLMKDCITGYLTKKISKDNNKLKYIDVKESQEAKRIIFKTVQSKMGFNSVAFNKNDVVLASEIDMII